MSKRLSVITEIDETIPDFYSGRNVFVTGFSGFIGKVLVEKLLRSCPDVGNIYVLIREKHGQGVQKRVDEIVDNVLFDTIKSANIAALNKIVPIKGNLIEIGLGISQENREELIDTVSIVYHVAASVRFNTTLRDGILQNIRSTREVCRLAKELKNIAVFVHVSTAYCQIGENEIQERLYSPRGNWRHAIKIAEEMDHQLINAITSKYMEGFPNTYTFTKCLAESCVVDLCSGRIPTIIFRPTIVIGTQMDPIEGWVDNLNGPIGLLVAVKKGILRTVFCTDIRYDYIPVDELVRAMIKITWIQSYLRQDEISVYNCSSNNIHDFTTKRMSELGDAVAEETLIDPLWHFSKCRTNSNLLYASRSYAFQIFPAFLVDVVLKLLNKKPIALKIQRRIFQADDQLDYFKHHEFTFLNDKYLGLDDHLLMSDREQFGMIFKEFDFQKNWCESGNKVAKIILKEDISNPERLKKKQRLLAWVHFFVKYTSYGTVAALSFKSMLVPFLNSSIEYVWSL